MRYASIPLFAVISAFCACAAAEDVKLDTAKIEQLTGAKGQLSAATGVFKVTFARTDLNISAGGVKLNPATGLSCWAAFKAVGDHTVMMGDQCLLEDQVNPVMSVALENGLEVTALHNHFFWDSPRVMFMHIGGMGEQEKLAEAVGKVFAKIRQTSGGKGEIPTAQIDAANSHVDGAKITQILGEKGEDAKGVYKVTIGRTTQMHGHDMGKAMGVNTWAAFMGTDQQAAVDGDFAMTEAELQGVLKALRGHGINVVAIHNHMTGENPRILFLHYWGIGSTEQLAKGLKAALDTQRQQNPASGVKK